MVDYTKNIWNEGNENQTVEANLKINAVPTADKMNHIEDGISNVADAANTAQTTAESRLPLAGGNVTGDLRVKNKIVLVAGDVYTNAQIDTSLEKKLNLTGGTVTGVTDFSNGLQKNGSNVINEIDIKNYYTIQFELGGFVWASGAEYPNNDRVRSGRLPSVPGKKLTIQTLNLPEIGSPIVFFYKGDNTLISNGVADGITIPPDTAYMRLLYQNYKVDKVILNLLVVQE